MPSIYITPPRAEFITPKFWDSWNVDAMRLMEECGRVSHKSEGRITAESAAPFLNRIAIRMGHESIIEHAGFTVCFVGSRSMSHQLVRHRIGAYCITGDTELVAYSVTGRSPKRWTIEQLYKWQDDPKRKGRLRLIVLRSVDRDGIIVPGKIKKIIDTGIQHTFQVKTRCNKTLRCTDNEWFMTDNGWKRLHELSIGNRIKVNGNLAYRDEEWLRKHYLGLNMQRTEVAELAGVSDACIGKWISKYGLQKPRTQYPNRQAGHGVSEMHGDEGCKAISKRMKGEGNHRWKGDEAGEHAGRKRAREKYTSLGTCDCCDNLATHRHHIDEKTLNNDESNVVPLCDACHASHHIGQAVLVVHNTPITSILACGVERTYDVEMDTPDLDLRNYIAGGFLIHNTQESQRYCDYSSSKQTLYDTLQVIMPPSIMGGSKALWGQSVSWVNDNRTMVVGGEALRSFLNGVADQENLSGDQIENGWEWCKQQLLSYLAYLFARERGIPSEDARSHLTNACKTEVYVTYNFRMWRHVLGHPNCGRALNDHAQWEIKMITYQVLEMFRESLPDLFMDLGTKITFEKDELQVIHRLVNEGSVIRELTDKAGMGKTARTKFWEKLDRMEALAKESEA